MGHKISKSFKNPCLGAHRKLLLLSRRLILEPMENTLIPIPRALIPDPRLWSLIPPFFRPLIPDPIYLVTTLLYTAMKSYTALYTDIHSYTSRIQGYTQLYRDKWWNRELTLKCKLKCYLNPWITHRALALIKGNREPHEAKKKSFDLGGNRTHDLRIRSTVTLPTELRGRTEKVGDDLGWRNAAKRK